VGVRAQPLACGRRPQSDGAESSSSQETQLNIFLARHTVVAGTVRQPGKSAPRGLADWAGRGSYIRNCWRLASSLNSAWTSSFAPSRKGFVSKRPRDGALVPRRQEPQHQDSADTPGGGDPSDQEQGANGARRCKGTTAAPNTKHVTQRTITPPHANDSRPHPSRAHECTLHLARLPLGPLDCVCPTCFRARSTRMAETDHVRANKSGRGKAVCTPPADQGSTFKRTNSHGRGQHAFASPSPIPNCDSNARCMRQIRASCEGGADSLVQRCLVLGLDHEEGAAEGAARGRKVPTGAYLCRSCNRWHLTSKSATQTPPWAKVKPP
jgi:hypothetical protein